MKITLIITTIFLFTLQAVEQVAAEGSIDLKTYISYLKDSHPKFPQERLSLDIQQEIKESITGEEDWLLTGSTQAQHQNHSSASNIFNEQENTFVANTSVQRNFWSTGSSLSLGYSYLHTDQSLSSNTRFDEHQSQIQAEYRLPLLKNRGGVLMRLSYELALLTQDLIEISSQENLEAFLESQSLRFIDWVFLDAQKTIAENRLSLAKEELKRTKRKRKSRLVANVDVLTAEDAVYNARLNLRNIEREWLAVRNELANQIQNNQLSQQRPAFDLYEFSQPAERTIILEQLKQSARQLKIIQIQMAQNKQNQKGFNSSLKPQLDLVVGTGLGSENDTLSSAQKYDEPQLNIGLDLSYPLGSRTAKANLKASQFEQQQLALMHETSYRTISSTLINLDTQLRELTQTLKLNREQVNVAKRRTEEELVRHNQGKSELSFVIQSRDNEQNAQLSQIANAVLYQKLWISYQSLLDGLL